MQNPDLSTVIRDHSWTRKSDRLESGSELGFGRRFLPPSIFGRFPVAGRVRSFALRAIPAARRGRAPFKIHPVGFLGGLDRGQSCLCSQKMHRFFQPGDGSSLGEQANYHSFRLFFLAPRNCSSRMGGHGFLHYFIVVLSN